MGVKDTGKISRNHRCTRWQVADFSLVSGVFIEMEKAAAKERRVTDQYGARKHIFSDPCLDNTR